MIRMAWPDDLVPRSRMGFRRHERGASPPANPCFFVVEHHVGWANRSTGTDGVVPHRPQTLIPSSSGTTPLISSNRTIPGTRPGFPEFPSPPKNEKCRQGAAPAAPCRHFPFPYQSVETVPLCTLRGQSLSYPNPLLCFALLCSALLCSAEFSKK